MMSRPGAGLVALLSVVLLANAGCSGGRGDAPRAARPPGVRLDQFQDIPLPPGWRPVPGEEQVAVAIGGGAVRRLQLSRQAPSSRHELQPDQAIARFVSGILPDDGWVRVDGGRPNDTEQRWTKGEEILEVRAAREDSLAVLRYRLVLAPLPR